jgi:hypothetical protein
MAEPRILISWSAPSDHGGLWVPLDNEGAGVNASRRPYGFGRVLRFAAKFAAERRRIVE